MIPSSEVLRLPRACSSQFANPVLGKEKESTHCPHPQAACREGVYLISDGSLSHFSRVLNAATKPPKNSVRLEEGHPGCSSFPSRHGRGELGRIGLSRFYSFLRRKDSSSRAECSRKTYINIAHGNSASHLCGVVGGGRE